MKISALFDQSKDIHRPIEKVITYGASQENRLKSEIAEYVVTDSIEDHFEDLLSKIQTAMESGGQNEVGVWVSGFYGSGKSSFTKYLGLALDPSVRVGNTPFMSLLQERLHKPTSKALLSTLASRYPAAIVMLDLASEMIAGATMKEVSTVLYYKVLQWAGYSRNLKVAAFERRLKCDGRYDEFLKLISERVGVQWTAIQNDPLAVDSLVPEVAHDMYPDIFRSTSTFNTDASDIITFEDDRVAEMLEIVKEATGREYVIFIVDEVGQYVGSRDHLITNLDGLAKNLKNIGDGKAWIIGTAQQTLTEDDPRAALNAPELFKLEARFPIKIDLESRDIREICYRRLLGKSPKGEKVLSDLFEQHGQALRHHTKLQDARYYDANLNKEAFVNLYPFLPAHFDILLHLLAVLAKRTGGIGLRSAIKIVQDILIEGPEESDPVADKPVGWLISTATLYDALERDIRSSTGSVRSVYEGVNKAIIRYPDSEIHQAVAKTVGLLQVLDNLPITRQNTAALLHASVDAPSVGDKVDAAVSDLINDSIVPFGEKDGRLRFFSEKLNDIDQERGQIPLRAMETRRIFNENLREMFSPLPAVRLDGLLAVETGLKVMLGSQVSSLAGDRNAIQTVVEFVTATSYDTERTKLVEESRQRTSANSVYLLGRVSSDIDDRVAEVYRCREISQRHRNDPDQEVKEYCAGQADRAIKLATEIQHAIRRQLAQGSFIFRGQTTALESLSNDVTEACKKHLTDVASQVFERYSEAPARADTMLAERFLRAGNLKAITSALDPLSLVQVQGGIPRVNCDHKALVSVRDYLDRNGTVEGKRLSDHFGGAPFGWSPDTLRYMVAALLIAGEIKLRVSGREVTVNGQQAIEALKTNNTFKWVGVSLRLEQIPHEVLVRSSERLTELTGDSIIPLEQEISKAAAKYLPQVQHQIGTLAEKLGNLALPGADQIRNLSQELADIMLTDASDAPQRMGAEDSSLYDSLRWASLVNAAFSQGMESSIRQLQEYRREISTLPRTGIPGKLQTDLEEDMKTVQDRLSNEDFHKHATDYHSLLRTIRDHTSDAAAELADSQKQAVKDAQEDLTRLADWSELDSEEQSDVFARLEELIIDASADIKGLRLLINKDYEITQRASELKHRIQAMGQKRRLDRLQEEKERAKKEGKKKLTRSVTIPGTSLKLEQLTELIGQLQKIKDELEINSDIEISIILEEKDNNGL